MTEVGNDIRVQVSGSLITAREDLAMYRIRFILTGAVFGIAWACSLRAAVLIFILALLALGITGFLYASDRRWRSRMAGP